MLFKIVLDPDAVKELKKISRGAPGLSVSLKRAIDSLAINPLDGKPLSGNKKGCFSLRKGDYRIIYEILTTDHLVHIIQIGHRKDVYR